MTRRKQEGTLTLFPGHHKAASEAIEWINTIKQPIEYGFTLKRLRDMIRAYSHSDSSCEYLCKAIMYL